MKHTERLILIIVFTLFALPQLGAQYTLSLNGTAYSFINSNDNNIHYGAQIRGSYDWLNYAIEYDFGYFAPVISVIPTTVAEVHPESPFPMQLNISNSVSAVTLVNNVNFHYYFSGMPYMGTGFYAIGGLGTFYYRQQYKLSSFDSQKYYSQQYIDGATYSSTQLVVNVGVGGKHAIRNTSWFYEAKFSYLTNPYNDWSRAVQGSHFITLSTGFRFHIVTRKSKYVKMSMGRTKKQKRKSKKRLWR